ncbi:MAG: outer membrane protein assembly factor BamB family protein [Streptosporangiaceae bacterium]
MRSPTHKAFAVLAAAAVVGSLGASAANAAPRMAKMPPLTASERHAGSGARLWIKRYNGPANGSDDASSVAVSPAGSAVFVTGTSSATSPGQPGDYLTVAYNAATGARMWTARYNGPANSFDEASAVKVSPDGSTVFVTGGSEGDTGDSPDFATVAYRASDGTRLWVARFDGPSNAGGTAAALSVARDGSAVFVTGTSYDSASANSGITTVAYRASDGTQLWMKDWAPASCCNYYGRAIVSPGGNRVFVTGLVQSATVTAEYGTVAYNATTGARLWSRRFAGTGATAFAVSPDLAKVYVTGMSHFDYTTLAYSARSGARLWLRRYNGGKNYLDQADSVAVSPAGTVLVTGLSNGPSSSPPSDYATVAYSPTGAQLWVRRYNGPGNNADTAYAIAAPGNGKAYVTGSSWGGSATGYDYATVAYNIRTGATVWVRRYNGPANGSDKAVSLAALGGRVFVTGGSLGTTSEDDYATIAYNG